MCGIIIGKSAGERMAELSLGEYTEQVKDLINAKKLEEAVIHCQHMLRHFPQYIEAYRLLGEVALEMGRQDEAADLFRRVLGADPENLMARVGLAVIAENLGALDEAIWQLERALELAPDKNELRQELHAFYTKRDGRREPRRIKPTRGGLGRIYLAGEEYKRAIEEFKAVLAQDAERVDLRVALAESFWRDGQHKEAAETCQAILEKFPYCLKANLIAGEVWQRSGLEAEARSLLQRARGLDPEGAFAQAFMGDASPLPTGSVVLSEPEEMTREVGPITGAPIPAPAIEAAPVEPEEVPAEARPSWAAEAPTEQVAAEIPDWLQAPEEKVPVAEAAAPPVAEAPSWLQEYKPATPLEAEAETPAEEAVEAEPKPAAEEKPVPLWLREFREKVPEYRGLMAETPEEERAPGAAAPTAEMPEEASVPAAVEPVPSEEPTPPLISRSDLPWWLQPQALPARVEEKAAPTQEAVEPAPAAGAQAEVIAPVAPPSEPAPAAEARVEEVPAPVAPAVEPMPAETVTPGEGIEAPVLPDWLRGLREEVPAAPPAEEKETPTTVQPEERAEAPVETAPPAAKATPVRRRRRAKAAVETVPPTAEAAPVRVRRRRTKVSVETVPPAAEVTPVRRKRRVKALVETVPPAAEVIPVPTKAPREVTTYLDDSAAPKSVMEQVGPATKAEEEKARLDLARTLRQIGDDKAALEQYRLLVDGETMIHEVVADLDKWTAGTDDLTVHRLLAEAYARAGRMQDAVDKYRWILTKK